MFTYRGTVLIVATLLVVLSACNTDSPMAPVESEVISLYGPDASRAVMRTSTVARAAMTIEQFSAGVASPQFYPLGSSQFDTSQANASRLVVPVVALAWAALEVYSAYELIRICVPPFVDDWYRTRSINLRTKDACFIQVALSVSGEALAKKLIPAVKVTALRTAVKSQLDNLVTQRELQAIFNKTTKPQVTGIAQNILSTFYSAVVNGMRDIFKRFW